MEPDHPRCVSLSSSRFGEDFVAASRRRSSRRTTARHRRPNPVTVRVDRQAGGYRRHWSRRHRRTHPGLRESTPLITDARQRPSWAPRTAPTASTISERQPCSPKRCSPSSGTSTTPSGSPFTIASTIAGPASSVSARAAGVVVAATIHAARQTYRRRRWRRRQSPRRRSSPPRTDLATAGSGPPAPAARRVQRVPTCRRLRSRRLLLHPESSSGTLTLPVQCVRLPPVARRPWTSSPRVDRISTASTTSRHTVRTPWP